MVAAVSEAGLTEEDFEKLRVLSEAETVNSVTQHSDGVMRDDPVDNPPEKRTKAYSVSERLCQAIRDHLENNSYHETARHFGLNVMTVKRHSTTYTERNCSHESEGIDEQRCAVMRGMARDGWSQRELADHFDVVRGTSRYHIVGQCSCDHAVPAVDYSGNPDQVVTPRICAEMRKKAHRGASQRDILEAIDGLESKAGVRHHLKGGCTCDVSIPAVSYETTEVKA